MSDVAYNYPTITTTDATGNWGQPATTHFYYTAADTIDSTIEYNSNPRRVDDPYIPYSVNIKVDMGWNYGKYWLEPKVKTKEVGRDKQLEWEF